MTVVPAAHTALDVAQHAIDQEPAESKPGALGGASPAKVMAPEIGNGGQRLDRGGPRGAPPLRVARTRRLSDS